MAQKTDLELITESNIIRDETAIGANTALRVGTMFDNLVDSKINNDRVSDSTSLGNSTTLVPSQNAVKTYVDAFATGLLTDNGNYDPTITGEYPTSGDTLSGGAVQKGDIWYISADGTMNGNAVLVGYSVRALVDNAGATTDANWSISNVGIGFVPENVANKSTDVNLGTSDVYYPSQNAVKSYVDAQVLAVFPYTPENIANKNDDITANPSSTVLYPSNKAVADYVNLGINLQTATDNGNITTNDIHVYNVIDSSNATDSAAAYLNNVVGDGGVVGIKKADGTTGEIKATNLTANRNYELPDASGTLALTSDIPSVVVKPEYRVRIFQSGIDNPSEQSTFIDTITVGTPYVSTTWRYMEFIRVATGTFKLRLLYDLTQTINGFFADISFSDNKITNGAYSQGGSGTEQTIEFTFYVYNSSGTLTDGITWSNVYLKLW